MTLVSESSISGRKSAFYEARNSPSDTYAYEFVILSTIRKGHRASKKQMKSLSPAPMGFIDPTPSIPPTNEKLDADNSKSNNNNPHDDSHPNSGKHDGDNSGGKGTSFMMGGNHSPNIPGGNTQSGLFCSPLFAFQHCNLISSNFITFGSTPEWIHDSGTPQPPCAGPPFTATIPGSQVSVQFSGTEITVFGHLFANESQAPAAVYTIDANSDNQDREEQSLPRSSADVPNQMFFRSPALPAGNHSLSINVTATNAFNNYTITHFIACDHDGSKATAAAVNSTISPSHGHTRGLEPGAIAGIIIACISFVLSAVLACILLRRRQRRTRSARTADSRVSRWLGRHTPTLPGSLFTSSTSIMRNMPSDHSVVPASLFDRSSVIEKSGSGYTTPFPDSQMSPRLPASPSTNLSKWSSVRRPQRKRPQYSTSLPPLVFADRSPSMVDNRDLHHDSVRPP